MAACLAPIIHPTGSLVHGNSRYALLTLCCSVHTEKTPITHLMGWDEVSGTSRGLDYNIRMGQ